MLSVHEDGRVLLRQLMKDLSSSREWSLCAFSSLARSVIECCHSLDFIASLFAENTALKPLSIPWLIVDFISMGDRCLSVFMFHRAGCGSVHRSKRFS